MRVCLYAGALLAVASGGWLLSEGFAESRRSEKPQAARQGPLSPEQALEEFELHPALKIELVAAEPDVVDPVAMAFDEDGRLWVAEMGDYPNGPGEGQPPLSKIKWLEDRDGDGRYETAHVFAENLLFANGIQPWRGGVIATIGGEVTYFKDTDGDGKADLKETWFAGFTQENPQLRANHPTFGLDNHIYIANGLRGGVVAAKRDIWAKDAKPVNISGMDFRFDPLTGKYEAVSGNGQFGLAFDDFGNRFVCSNRNPCRHLILEDHYLKRNPHLAVTSVSHDVSPAGEASRVFAITNAWTTSTLHAGQFTAACGVTIYRGDALPAEFRGNSFTCEPTGSLVHRDVLAPSGATFTSRPGREGVEFLASRDDWFRPVNMAHGPDGALYVVDMYRAVIEHPQFMPTELKNRPDLRYGDDRGRIWRIVPAEGATSDRERPQLSKAGTAELVALLEHANSWQRETAQRLLFERQDKGAAAALQALATGGKTPQARIHALWTLQGLGLLEPELLGTLLDPAQAGDRVSEQAVRLAEPLLSDSKQASRLVGKQESLAHVLAQLVQAGDARVRFQTALSVGEAGDGEQEWLAPLLATICLKAGDDDWTRTAALSSAAEHPHQVLEHVLKAAEAHGKWNEPGVDETVRRVAELVAGKQERAGEALGLLAKDAASPDEIRVRLAGLRGLGKGLRRRGKALAATAKGLPESTRAALTALIGRAADLAGNADATAALRTEAIDLLRYTDFSSGGETLLALAQSEPSQPLRLAAIEALASHSDPRVGETLMVDFASQTPVIRRAILDTMLSHPERAKQLLAALEAGEFERREIDAARSQRLMKHRDASIRQRAVKLLTVAVDADRKKVIDEYGTVLDLKADPRHGREVFAKNCVTCHRIGDLGVNVAPDIGDSRTKTPAQLLTDILDPNRAVDNNYFSYTVITLEGQVLTGIIATETASSITLRQPDDKTITVLRDEIDEVRSNGVSLMPVGLEKNIPPQEMADLISFIKNWRYLDGRIPVSAGE